MEKGDWYPIVLALAFQQVGVLLAVFFPETLHVREKLANLTNIRQDIELPRTEQIFNPRQQLRYFQEAFRF